MISFGRSLKSLRAYRLSPILSASAKFICPADLPAGLHVLAMSLFLYKNHGITDNGWELENEYKDKIICNKFYSQLL